jgi:peptidoglycan hydrolase CwlO-like protein
LTSARPSRVSRLLATVATILLIGALAQLPAGADSADTKKQLDAAKADLAALEQKITGEQATLDSLHTQLAALSKQLDTLQTKLARTQYRIVKKQAEIEDAVGALTATQSQLDQRAWTAYVYGPGSGIEFLLGATSLSDLNDRLEIVNSAAQSDQDLIIDLQQQQNHLRSREAELEALQTDLEDEQSAVTNQNDKVQSKTDDAQKTYDSMQADFDAADRLVNDLTVKYNDQKAAEEKARLEALKKAREQQQQQQGGGGGSGGEIGDYAGVFKACPVNGFVTFSDDFGAPRYGGGYHLHAGNDMFAARGTPIVAPFDGQAEDATNGLGGLAVKVFGHDGWVYNAHLDTIGKLGTVSKGDVIGTVGNTGDAQGGATHDHFEWHPNDPSQWPTWTSPYGVHMVGDAIDPYPFLLNAC